MGLSFIFQYIYKFVITVWLDTGQQSLGGAFVSFSVSVLNKIKLIHNCIWCAILETRFENNASKRYISKIEKLFSIIFFKFTSCLFSWELAIYAVWKFENWAKNRNLRMKLTTKICFSQMILNRPYRLSFFIWRTIPLDDILAKLK